MTGDQVALPAPFPSVVSVTGMSEGEYSAVTVASASIVRSQPPWPSAVQSPPQATRYWPVPGSASRWIGVPKSKTGAQSVSQVVVAPSAETSTEPIPVMSTDRVRRSSVKAIVTSDRKSTRLNSSH